MAEQTLMQSHFCRPWRKSDVVLVIEDHKFHVHRQYLSLQSQVFEAMFNSDVKEKHEKYIDLPGKNALRFEEFLSLLYTKAVEITKENCEELLSLGREYQVEGESIRGPCEVFLKKVASDCLSSWSCNSCSLSFDCLWSLRVAAEFDLDGALEESAEIGKKMIFVESYSRNQEYVLTNDRGKAVLLEKRVIVLQDTLHSLMKQCQYKEEIRGYFKSYSENLSYRAVPTWIDYRNNRGRKAAFKK